jgi:hypothetical protein
VRIFDNRALLIPDILHDPTVPSYSSGEQDTLEVVCSFFDRGDVHYLEVEPRIHAGKNDDFGFSDSGGIKGTSFEFDFLEYLWRNPATRQPVITKEQRLATRYEHQDCL